MELLEVHKLEHQKVQVEASVEHFGRHLSQLLTLVMQLLCGCALCQDNRAELTAQRRLVQLRKIELLQHQRLRHAVRPLHHREEQEGRVSPHCQPCGLIIDPDVNRLLRSLNVGLQSLNVDILLWRSVTYRALQLSPFDPERCQIVPDEDGQVL